jgi:PilZ domain
MKDAERREKERFRPKKRTFVVFKPQFLKLGKVLDISVDGLCFQYLAKEDQVGDAPAIEADIFMSDNGYYLPDISCKLIWDTEAKEKMTFPIGFQNRRCGLRFVQLNKEQQNKLEHYLQVHTAGKV